jgi:bifunctional UDP-N-acetylglucosamine pyrophosphorylase/glucosamine-1-phosphate N-acetyltransferase
MRADPVAVLLAAGEGTRMGPGRPKVLLPILGKPMLGYVVEAMREAGVKRIVAVVGKGAPEVRGTFGPAGLEFVEQHERLGTAHAVQQALPVLQDGEEEVVIAPGDAPLLGATHITGLLNRHRRAGSKLTVMAAAVDEPAGLGRIVRGADGAATRIAEELDATVDERALGEVNVGVYCVAQSLLAEVLPRIGNDNRKGEYYLTDMVELASSSGVRVAVYRADPPPLPVGVNTPEQLQRAEEALRALHAGATPGLSVSQ